MIFSVTVLGSNSASPTPNRHPTAHLINHLHRLFLADCGEGTQVQLQRYRIKYQRINHIFITHLHGDHYFGLIGLLTTYHLLGRTKPLCVYAPDGLEEIIQLQLKASRTTLRYPLEICVVDTTQHQIIYQDDSMQVKSLPLQHSVPTCGYLFAERQLLRRMRPGIVQSLKIPIDKIITIKNGGDFIDCNGKIYSNDELTLDPPVPRSYAFGSDTVFDPRLPEMIKGANLLYHEASFAHNMAIKAHEKHHSTAYEAASIAHAAGVKQLMIGHYSARYDDPAILLFEAQAVFPATVLAEEGTTYYIQ